MQHDMQVNRPGWPLATKVAFAAFALVDGYFLIAEHRAHLIYAVPYLPVAVLLGCVLMHVFMHHGGSHSGDHAMGNEGKPL